MASFISSCAVAETAAKHFAGKAICCWCALTPQRKSRVGASRGGALFPHLYGDLDLTLVTRVDPLSLWPDGRHVFPPLND
jgi:uncharacterized protein (DUF952 family)